MRIRMSPSVPVSHHGHGLRASLALAPLHAVLSLRPGQRRAGHDRGEKCGVAPRPRGRAIGNCPARSTGTVRRVSAWSVRGSKLRPWEDGRSATLARTGGRPAVPQHGCPTCCGTFQSRSRRPKGCRRPRCRCRRRFGRAWRGSAHEREGQSTASRIGRCRRHAATVFSRVRAVSIVSRVSRP